MNLICEFCGKSFCSHREKNRKPSRFCSKECRVKSNDKIIKCLQCGKEFRIPAGISRERKFCSQTCSNRYNQKPDEKKKSVFVCKWCGKEFTEWAYRNPTMCSRQCASEYGARQPREKQRKPENKIKIICAMCGKEFTIHKSQNENGRTARYCSVICKLRSRISSPEIKCKKILDDANIQYEHQKQIKQNLFVDFAIGKIILQIDGEYWHGHPRFHPLTKNQISQRKRDAAQDKYLIACGYTVIRVWESDVTNENILTLLQYS